jgi:tetratricopeptide (TPR) repeat protein
MKKITISLLCVLLASCSSIIKEQSATPTVANPEISSQVQALANEVKVLKQNLAAHEEMLRLQIIFNENKANSLDLHRLGNLYLFKGWYDQAEWVFKKLSMQSSEKIRALNGLGVLYFRKGNMPEALNYFSKALKEDSKDVDTLNNMAIWHFKNGNLDTAKGFLAKVFKVNPNHPEANANMGSIHHKAKDYKKAVDYLTKALEINNKPLGPRMMLAESYEGLNELTKAEKEYRFILAMDSGNEIAATGLSRLMERKKS